MDLTILKIFFNEWEILGDRIIVNKELAKSVVFVKENYAFDILKSITAIDLKENGTELLYTLFSTKNEEELILSITVYNEAESISSIFDSAVADEKEIYDLFGIKFVGNKELCRLYMPDGWKGHPLKKDYQENDERLNWNE